MFRGLNQDDVPVLYEIYNLNKDGFNYFMLDDEDYTFFLYD